MDTQTGSRSLLTEPLVKSFRGRNFAFLGTLNKDGSPQVTPTWVDIEEKDHEEMILVNTAMDRVKQKNVSRDPRVSISIVDKDNPYSMVTIKGRVRTHRQACKEISQYPVHSPNVKRIILKIKPEKIFYIPPRYEEYLRKIK